MTVELPSHSEGECCQTVSPLDRRRQQADCSVLCLICAFSVLALSGVGGLVLSILAFAIPDSAGYFLPIAAITLGSAFLIVGLGIASHFNCVARETDSVSACLGLACLVDITGGAAAIALGILALLQIDSQVLLSVAVLVLGAILILGSRAVECLAHIRTCTPWPNYARQRLAQYATSFDACLEAFVGIGVAVLGILAIIGVGNVMILVSAALIAVSSQALVSGVVLRRRMFAFLWD